MEIMSVLNNVIMTPDKKVEEYLVRARTLIRTKLVGIDWETPEHALLVAQMIQLEDHNKPKITNATSNY